MSATKDGHVSAEKVGALNVEVRPSPRSPYPTILNTNRDLYLAVNHLEFGSATLEDCLSSLWRITRDKYLNTNVDGLSLQELFSLLEQCLTTRPPPFSEVTAHWTKLQVEEAKLPTGFADWERTILSQIVALHRINNVGDSTREPAQHEERWSNLTPKSFFLSGVGATLGGYSNDQPLVHPVNKVTWGQFSSLLQSGRRTE